MIEEHEEQLLDAFRSFTRLERILRQAIGEALSTHFGTQWTKQIPDAIRDRIEEKEQDISESNLGPEREKGLLAFADFSELVLIIQYFWDKIFHNWFPDKQVALGLLEEIRSYRNALMHSVLLPTQCPTLIGLCQEFIKLLDTVPKELSVQSAEPSADASQTSSVPSLTTEDQTAFDQRVSVVLSEMTGRFEGERDALLEFLEENLNLCTHMLLEKVRHRFIDLPETDIKIRTLERRLPPERPKPPDPKWRLRAAKWLRWVARSYMPYRYWMMVNNQYDEEIESMSQNYEAWLHNSYTELLSRDPKRFVCGSYLHISSLLEQNRVVLWILVDNLPLFSQSTLIKQLSEHGFRVKEMMRQIALLPSETSISRKSALVGRLPNEIPENSSETETVLNAWRSRTDKRVIVLKNLEELKNIGQQQAELFIYVYGRLDSLWHTPTSKDFEREEEIEIALARLALRLFTAMTQLEQRDPALLVISTDHGSTYLNRRTGKVPVPLSATRDTPYENHHRFIRTSRSDALNDVDWFYLDKDEFHLHHHYAVARGWRYIDSCPRGYTHGGLTPEETVVPMLIFELGESEFDRLHPIYEHANEPLRLGRPGKLVIRVRNPYRMTIEDLEISLSDYGLTFLPISIEPQMEAATEPVEFQLPAKASVEQDAVFVNLIARFAAGGQQRSDRTKLRIKVRQLFSTDLDDEFGAMFS